jgi:hypothetical protein
LAHLSVPGLALDSMSLRVRGPHDVEIEELRTAVVVVVVVVVVAAAAAAYLGHGVKHYLLPGFRTMKAVSELQEMASYVQRQAARSLLGLYL